MFFASTSIAVTCYGKQTETFAAQQLVVSDVGFNQRYRIEVSGIQLPADLIEDISSITVSLVQDQAQLVYHGDLLQVKRVLTRAGNDITLTIGCSLSRLDNLSNQQIFVDKTVAEIVSAILTPYSIPFSLDLVSTSYRIPYFAQGGVSDYEFFLRLCVSEGLVFYYRQNKSEVMLHITDDKPESTLHLVQFNPLSGQVGKGGIAYSIQRQQQVDWQCERLEVLLFGVWVEPGDVLKLIGDNIAGFFEVISYSLCFDEQISAYRQAVFLIPTHQTYRLPTKANSPVLNLFLGECLESVDQNGCYLVKARFLPTSPAFKARFLQPASGSCDNPGFGFHFPIKPKSTVVLAHLDGQIDKPFILGLLPNMSQPSPVSSKNRHQLMVQHGSGSGLIFSDTKPKQTIDLFLDSGQYGITLTNGYEISRVNINSQEDIVLKSQGDMRFQSLTTILIEASEHEINTQRSITLCSKQTMRFISGGNLQYRIDQNWFMQSMTSCSIVSNRGTCFNASGLLLGGHALYFNSKTGALSSEQAISIFGDDIACCVGDNLFSISLNGINLIANKITIEAQRIEKTGDIKLN